MNIGNRDKVELLAPAGSLLSFFAAVEKGADAVFCGLKTFSARAKAQNFTLDEVEQLSGYAHSEGRKIYVALNTLIKEKELPALVDDLSALKQYRVDGLIVQDLGLCHIANKYFPELPLHASTQMTIHNSAGIRVLEELGFTRAVLARELSLQEIATIGRHSSLELEHFVHGALCYSISGHCLFSSYLDGRSGNRGGCVQPCRRRYTHQKKSGFYFSTSDFSAIELIPDLLEAGINSFKIEGRMKSPEYVAAVVAAYRMVIDAARGDRQAAVTEARSMLKNAMGRKSTQGFLSGRNRSDIVVPTQKGGIGQIIGKVEQLRGRNVVFRSREAIHVGDRLRIQPVNDRTGRAFTVKNLFLGRKQVKRVNRGEIVSIPLSIPGQVQSGDTIFKLSTGKIFTMSEERARKLLAAAPLEKTAVDVHVQCMGATIRVQASVGGNVMEKIYPVSMAAAERSPLTEETLYKVFRSTGQQQFVLNTFCAPDLPPVVIKPSRLKEIRRDFYSNLLQVFADSRKKQTAAYLQQVKQALQINRARSGIEHADKLFCVVEQFEDLQALPENSSVLYILTLTPQLLRESLADPGEVQALQRQLIWDLPSVVFDHQWRDLQQAVEGAVAAGFSRFRLNNLSHCELFQNVPNLQLWAGPWLYTMNNQSKKTLQELGIHFFCTGLEDDKENMRSLLADEEDGQMAVTVYGPVDLFTSRIGSLFREKESRIANDQGEIFQVSAIQGLTVTRAPKPFSLLGRVEELREMGCFHFILDMRGVALQSSIGQEIIQSFYNDTHLRETNSFNFDRGLQ